jgi:hypothetical protein
LKTNKTRKYKFQNISPGPPLASEGLPVGAAEGASRGRIGARAPRRRRRLNPQRVTGQDINRLFDSDDRSSRVSARKTLVLSLATRRRFPNARRRAATPPSRRRPDFVLAVRRPRGPSACLRAAPAIGAMIVGVVYAPSALFDGLVAPPRLRGQAPGCAIEPAAILCKVRAHGRGRPNPGERR